jgi:hypothetical protein
MQRPACELIHSLQSLRSFEIKFRHVVVAEDRSMTIIFQMEAARGQEPLCDLPRTAAIDAELDGRLGKSVRKILPANHK